jgi:hypothetical protein
MKKSDVFKLNDLQYKIGTVLRNKVWPEGITFIVHDTQDYCGTEFGFEPKHYGPSGFFGKDSKYDGTPKWIAGSTLGEWEIINEKV